MTPPTRSPISLAPVRRQPLAAQVERILSERLFSGEFEPGDRLPSEHELSADLTVSRATIRAAMGALTRRGLVVSRQGVGSFVSQANRMTNSLTEALDFHEVIDRGGSAPGVIFDSAVTEACPASIAELLSLPPGSEAHRSHKRFTADGETVIYATTTIPISVLTPRSAAEIETDPERSEPLFAFMAAQGLDTAYQLSSLAARVGRDVPYPDHDLDPDAAIIELAEVGYTDTNQAIWHSRNWYTPDAMAFDLVRRRPPDLPNQA